MRPSRLLFSHDFPRIHSLSSAITHKAFIAKYDSLQNGTKDDQVVTIRGRLSSKRSAGKTIRFLDIISNHTKLQAIAENCPEHVLESIKSISPGDHIELSGSPGRHARGELSVYIDQVKLLSKCSATTSIPRRYTDLEKRLRNRHLDYMVNQSASDVIRTRSLIIRTLREFLHDRDFIELETPILQGSASGAIARPFVTSSILGYDLQLRIAPELALKRAVVGGFDRVFEVGKCFRNEGLSRKHNPEFTTCEFYQAYAGLDDLMRITKELLQTIEAAITPDDSTDDKIFKQFEVIDFIPRLEVEMRHALPSTHEETLKLFKLLNLQVPEENALPNLYDTLFSTYLEPLCINPTFVINHPSILAPLAKSTNGISHRFEFIVNGIELINAYEEENDPSLQRQKFIKQNGGLTSEEEQYCSVLECGLPPTGGWGMGIDRLCMILTKSSRINEVLLSSGLQYQAREKTEEKHSSTQETDEHHHHRVEVY